MIAVLPRSLTAMTHPRRPSSLTGSLIRWLAVGGALGFGAKSIDEVKVKLVSLGLALKDSPPGFDPGAAVYFADEDDDDLAFAEDEQL